jgi:hypothetical protein
MSTTLVMERDAGEDFGRAFTSSFQVRILMIAIAVVVVNCSAVCQDVRKPGVPSELESIFVVGNVMHQRTIIASNGVTLMHAIAVAGGVKNGSDLVRVRILRGWVKKQGPIVIDLRAIIEHRIEDPLLQPKDIVEVSDEHGQFILQYPFRRTTPIWDPPLKPREELIC